MTVQTQTQPASEKVYRTLLDPVSFLRRSAYAYPDRVAVVHGEQGRRYTYREFDERVNRLASALQGAGMGKGDRVAFLCPNIPAMLEAHYAVPAAGGILVTINTRLDPEQVEYILEHSGARLLFVDRELEHLVEKARTAQLQVVRVDDSGESDDPYERFLAAASPEPLPSLLEDEEETISINYTSGTTGKPKGVMYTYRGGYLNALGEALETRLGPESVYLWTLPMFHCNGWCFTWGVTAVGGRHVCLRKVDPGVIWGLFESEEVTHYNGAPTVQSSLVNHPDAHRLGREITTTVAGAPPSPTLLSKLSELNIRPVHVYGLTETYGPVTVCERQDGWQELPIEQQAEFLGRQGVHYLVADPVRVVDDRMADVPADGQTLGEVLMRGNNVMKGYFRDDSTTSEAFEGGWFHSGDIAVMHPDGYIEIRDRKKDIIISGGENISTIEVEHAIVKHPAVLECAVVAMPDEKWGERPKAFVELKQDAELSEQELLDFARQHLAGFKRPAAVEFGELPRTATGKVQKFVLREKEWEGRSKRVG